MRVFVAGATGAVGRPLVSKLGEAGHEVAAASRSAERADALRELGAEPVVCDALDAASVSRAIEQARPEVVVNQLTAIPARINPRKMVQAFEPTSRLRREGTANLMAAAAEQGVRRVVSQSIAFAYAPTNGGAWTEEDRLYTEESHIVRAVAELEERTLGTDGVEGVVLRYGFFYGPRTAYGPGGDNLEAIRRRQFPVIGGGRGVFAFVHVEDAASAALLAVDRGAPGIYNVVDDDPAPLHESLPELARILGARPPRRVPRLLARLAAGPLVTRYATELQAASNAKAKRELGWEPRWPSWRQGFREALG